MQNSIKQISVIMPVLNEEKNIALAIESTLEAFNKFKLNAEIIVVNDGSIDKVEKIVNDLEKQDSRIRLIEHLSPKGIGISFWDGVDLAQAEAVVMLPGDNENHPEEILQYYQLLQYVDIIIPFVFNREVRPVFRNAISFIYGFIINLSFGTNFNYTNGNVIFRRSILKDLDCRSSGFFFQTDILVRLVKKGYLFCEVPYRLGLRKSGVSKSIQFPSLITIAGEYIRLLRDYWFNKKKYRLGLLTSDSVSSKRYQNAYREGF